MQQIVTIAVLRSSFEDEGAKVFSSDELTELAQKARKKGELLHFLSYIDQWSMLDSFAKYLPTTAMRQGSALPGASTGKAL